MQVALGTYTTALNFASARVRRTHLNLPALGVEIRSNNGQLNASVTYVRFHRTCSLNRTASGYLYIASSVRNP